MKLFFLISGLLLPSVAGAQVVVNPAALTQLAGIGAPAQPVASAQMPMARPVVQHLRVHRRPAAAIEKTPAPVPVVARVIAPAAPPAPPKQASLPGPATLQFADGSSALPGNAAGLLKPFCGTGFVVGINARAAGDPSDPSIALRLSLARALAVRDALVACGVPTLHILPRALGAVPGQNENETVLGLVK